MGQRTYRVELTGTTGLLLRADNIQWAEHMKEWEKNPDNKKISIRGDDRSPAWRWLGCVYHDGETVGIPSDNLMTTIREGGALVPTGQGQKTFKAQTQSGIIVNEIQWPILLRGKPVSWAPIAELRQEEEFSKHVAAIEAMGFELFAKRAKVGQVKHVRVRPRFNPPWSCVGTLTVFDDQITPSILDRVLSNAGRYRGLGDWRPGSPKSPGPWGTFTATIKEV